MKKLLIITLSIAIGFVSLSTVFAAEKSECIYRSKVDQMISFYQARLYLIDSEYKILSDIGKDAAKKISCLQEKKDQLVQGMKDGEVEFNSIKMKNYIAKKTRIGEMS